MPPKKQPKKSKSNIDEVIQDLQNNQQATIQATITDAPANVPNNLQKAIGRIKNDKNKKLIEDNLKKNELIKSTKNIVAYDPLTKQLISGNMSQIAKKIKSNPNTIKSRFNKGKQQHKDIKGFQILKFNNADDMVNFKNSITNNNQNIKVIKKKETPKPPPKKLYTIKDIGSQESDKYPLGKHHFKVNIEEDGMTYGNLEQMVGDFTSQAVKKRKLDSKDWIRIVIEDPNLKNMVSHSFVEVSKWTPSILMNKINEVVESNEEYIISSETTFIVESINFPHNAPNFMGSSYKNIIGRGGNKKEYHLKDNIFNKRSLIQIKNKDDLCCARAIVTQLSRIEEGVDSKNYDNIKRGRKIQEIRAKELHEKSGVPEGPCGIPEIMKFEEYLEDYQITVIDDMNTILYPDVRSKEYKWKEDENCIYLYYHDEHYDLIVNTKLAGFFSKDHFCHKCKKTYKVKDKHKCIFKCNMCCRSDCPVLKMKGKRNYNLFCECCDRYFCHQTCFNNHQDYRDKKGKSICDKIWKCQGCKKVLCKETQPKSEHKCGDFLCKNCGQVVSKNHKCYMMPKKLKPHNENIIFFDFESDISGENHEVMFSISMYYHDPTPIEHHSIEEFCLWAFNDKHKHYTLIAHNGKGYDYQFVLKWLYDNTDYEIETIYAGQKIMSIMIKGLRIRFIDSLCFITLPLKKFPKTFGQTELKKGYFPHWFNTKENRNYIGPMPPKKEFRCNGMKAAERKDFLKWYDGKVKEGYIWNQDKEMREYCISDVDILRKCLIVFRELYIKIADIDPLQYLTIAGVCMAIYKYAHIDKSFPERLSRMNKALGIEEVEDDEEYGELCDYYMSNYMIDIEEATDDEIKQMFKDETHNIVFNEKKIGVFPYKDALWFREGFFGGRTNGIKLLHHFKENEIGMYSDITSLYPTVQYYDPYPKGHYISIPYEKISNEHLDKVMNKEYKCAVFDIELQPPDDLYHPVLPQKKVKKTIEEGVSEETGKPFKRTHKEEKLTFDLEHKRGIWCSNEVYKAMDKGYKVIKLYEIKYWEETTTDLFKSYVNIFLKIKQEATGFPDWVFKDKEKLPPDIIEERKQLYIKDYLEKQGIKLEYDKIEKNPGLRYIAKLCLNSLWGKFGQRLNMTKSVLVNNIKDFYNVITNPQYEDFNTMELGNKGDKTRKCLINYKVKDEYVENDYNTNIGIACFTTSSARLRLYGALETLNRQVLYFDTDSVVYIYDKTNPEHKKLENGDLLGEWTDECEGNEIVGVFVTTGPKAYSYITNDGEAHTKIKGFNLNFSASKKINHEAIVNLVKDKYVYGKDEKISVKYDMLKRNADKTISNFTQDKSYGITYSKREVLEPDEYQNIDTIPFGFNIDKY